MAADGQDLFLARLRPRSRPLQQRPRPATNKGSQPSRYTPHWVYKEPNGEGQNGNSGDKRSPSGSTTWRKSSQAAISR